MICLAWSFGKGKETVFVANDLLPLSTIYPTLSPMYPCQHEFKVSESKPHILWKRVACPQNNHNNEQEQWSYAENLGRVSKHPIPCWYFRVSISICLWQSLCMMDLQQYTIITEEGCAPVAIDKEKLGIDCPNPTDSAKFCSPIEFSNVNQ